MLQQIVFSFRKKCFFGIALFFNFHSTYCVGVSADVENARRQQAQVASASTRRSVSSNVSSHQAGHNRTFSNPWAESRYPLSEEEATIPFTAAEIQKLKQFENFFLTTDNFGLFVARALKGVGSNRRLISHLLQRNKTITALAFESGQYNDQLSQEEKNKILEHDDIILRDGFTWNDLILRFENITSVTFDRDFVLQNFILSEPSLEDSQQENPWAESKHPVDLTSIRKAVTGAQLSQLINFAVALRDAPEEEFISEAKKRINLTDRQMSHLLQQQREITRIAFEGGMYDDISEEAQQKILESDSFYLRDFLNPAEIRERKERNKNIRFDRASLLKSFDLGDYPAYQSEDTPTNNARLRPQDNPWAESKYSMEAPTWNASFSHDVLDIFPEMNKDISISEIINILLGDYSAEELSHFFQIGRSAVNLFDYSANENAVLDEFYNNALGETEADFSNAVEIYNENKNVFDKHLNDLISYSPSDSSDNVDSDDVIDSAVELSNIFAESVNALAVGDELNFTDNDRNLLVSFQSKLNTIPFNILWSDLNSSFSSPEELSFALQKARNITEFFFDNNWYPSEYSVDDLKVLLDFYSYVLGDDSYVFENAASLVKSNQVLFSDHIRRVSSFVSPLNSLDKENIEEINGILSDLSFDESDVINSLSSSHLSSLRKLRKIIVNNQSVVIGQYADVNENLILEYYQDLINKDVASARAKLQKNPGFVDNIQDVFERVEKLYLGGQLLVQELESAKNERSFIISENNNLLGLEKFLTRVKGRTNPEYFKDFLLAFQSLPNVAMVNFNDQGQFNNFYASLTPDMVWNGINVDFSGFTQLDQINPSMESLFDNLVSNHLDSIELEISHESKVLGLTQQLTEVARISEVANQLVYEKVIEFMFSEYVKDIVSSQTLEQKQGYLNGLSRVMSFLSGSNGRSKDYTSLWNDDFGLDIESLSSMDLEDLNNLPNSESNTTLRAIEKFLMFNDVLQEPTLSNLPEISMTRFVDLLNNLQPDILTGSGEDIDKFFDFLADQAEPFEGSLADIVSKVPMQDWILFSLGSTNHMTSVFTSIDSIVRHYSELPILNPEILNDSVLVDATSNWNSVYQEYLDLQVEYKRNASKKNHDMVVSYVGQRALEYVKYLEQLDNDNLMSKLASQGLAFIDFLVEFNNYDHSDELDNYYGLLPSDVDSFESFLTKSFNNSPKDQSSISTPDLYLKVLKNLYVLIIEKVLEMVTVSLNNQNLSSDDLGTKLGDLFLAENSSLAKTSNGVSVWSSVVTNSLTSSFVDSWDNLETMINAGYSNDYVNIISLNSLVQEMESSLHDPGFWEISNIIKRVVKAYEVQYLVGAQAKKNFEEQNQKAFDLLVQEIFDQYQQSFIYEEDLNDFVNKKNLLRAILGSSEEPGILDILANCRQKDFSALLVEGEDDLDLGALGTIENITVQIFQDFLSTLFPIPEGYSEVKTNLARTKKEEMEADLISSFSYAANLVYKKIDDFISQVNINVSNEDQVFETAKQEAKNMYSNFMKMSILAWKSFWNSLAESEMQRFLRFDDLSVREINDIFLLMLNSENTQTSAVSV